MGRVYDIGVWPNFLLYQHSSEPLSVVTAVDSSAARGTIAYMEQKEYDYTVLYEPAEEGGYVVTCPALPGLVTEGDTLEEARAMAKDAIRTYLESLLKDGLPIPGDHMDRQTVVHLAEQCHCRR